MAVAREQLLAISKRLFSATSADKFSFLNTAIDSPWPFKDSNRWLVFIKRSYLKGATQEEKMDFYIKTAAQIVGSEEEAKERIYKFTRDCSFCGFGFEICVEAVRKFKDLPTVDSMGMDCTGRMLQNGEIIEWSLIPKTREKGRFPLPRPQLERQR